MFMSVVFLTALPRYFLAAGCRWEGWLSQRDSIAIENEDAAIAERDFFRLPTGFVALVGVLPAEAGLIIIGGDPLFDGLPGWLDRLKSEPNRGTDTLFPVPRPPFQADFNPPARHIPIHPVDLPRTLDSQEQCVVAMQFIVQFFHPRILALIESAASH